VKPGAIITPKRNDPAKARFYVRDRTRNGWVRCHGIRREQSGPQEIHSDYVFKFRTSKMEVVG
jgi:hypothetical protein